jgi:transposase InsO family protein
MKELLLSAARPGARLSVSRMGTDLSLSRATLYRSAAVADDETELRDAIQWIALEMPFYGYRRIHQELHRRGWRVNHKQVLRLLRQDNLLCLRKRQFVATTDSQHGLPVYPNLVPDLVVASLKQLWVADITYIRLQREFVYLAVILDAYSRRCIGWHLGARRLTDDLALAALQMALAGRQIAPGLVHPSDRGVQYASTDYTALLAAHQIAISMSRRGNPYDKAKAESFLKTLKYEEVYLCEYASLADAAESIEHFIDVIYNRKRLHSALGYLPPAEFEQQFAVTTQGVFP